MKATTKYTDNKLTGIRGVMIRTLLSMAFTIYDFNNPQKTKSWNYQKVNNSQTLNKFYHIIWL